MLPVADRLAIIEVIAQYSYTYDALDADGFAALFTENALWEYYLSGKDEPEISLNSQDEIRDWALPRLKARIGEFSSRHHQTGTVFDSQDSENPQTRTMVLVTHHEVGNPHPTTSLSGVYHDTWTKTTQGWKFAKRILYTDRTES
jgi:hypothetical protein